MDCSRGDFVLQYLTPYCLSSVLFPRSYSLFFVLLSHHRHPPSSSYLLSPFSLGRSSKKTRFIRRIGMNETWMKDSCFPTPPLTDATKQGEEKRERLARMQPPPLCSGMLSLMVAAAAVNRAAER